jgi:hypothetical protein
MLKEICMNMDPEKLPFKVNGTLFLFQISSVVSYFLCFPVTLLFKVSYHVEVSVAEILPLELHGVAVVICVLINEVLFHCSLQ